jgi:Fur family ferric uptake transcriptional regulator
MELRPVPKQSDLTEEDIRALTPLCAVFRRHLRNLGQKYTPERAQILETLIEMDELFQADQLQAQLRDRGHRVSKATVYRTLKLLQDSGIIQPVMLDADQTHYQLAYGRRALDLLIRLDTNEVIRVSAPELAAIRDKICAEHGLKADGHRFQIFARAR